MIIFHETKEFIKHLDDFLEDPDAINSAYLNSNKNRIPLVFRNYTSKLLYRGMFIDDKENFLRKESLDLTELRHGLKKKMLLEIFF